MLCNRPVSDVRFAPKSGRGWRALECLLCAISGRNRVLALLLKRPPDEAERAAARSMVSFEDFVNGGKELSAELSGRAQPPS